MAALVKAPGQSRSDSDIMFIVDFMKSTKLFASMAGNEAMLMKVASLVQLKSYVPDQTVFEEGEVCTVGSSVPTNALYLLNFR